MRDDHGKHLIVTLEYPPQVGGIATYVAEMKRQLGDEVDVLVLAGSVSVWRVLIDLMRRGRGVHSMVVHHVFPVGTAAWVMRMVRGVPYTLFFHGMDFDVARRSGGRRWLLARILAKAEAVCANSDALSREISEFSGREVKTVHPVLSTDFLASADAAGEPSKWSQTDGKLHLLTVGRLVARKNHAAVLRAIESRPEIQYHIVGDGPMRGDLEVLVSQLALENQVQFHGTQTGKPLAELYKQSDLFVTLATKSGTDREGFGIVYLEAQYCGVPVVAYTQPGVTEAIGPKSGWLIRSEAEFGDLMDRLIADRSLLQEMSTDARSFVDSHYLPAHLRKALQFMLD